MKNNIKNAIVLIAFIGSLISCNKDYLDINENPNTATSSSPQLVLPGALNSTAFLLQTYHAAGSWVNGYQSGAAGFSFVGTDVFTYNYTNTTNTGLFNSGFSNLRNYQYIITSTKDKPELVLFNATARIMKSFVYQMMVDQYGDLPYTEALQGTDILIPKYDKQEDIYKACVLELNAAIALLKTNATNTTIPALGSADIMLGGDVTKWIKFANNVKLRFLVRAQASTLSSFVNEQYLSFSSEGFLKEDVLINPGYSSASDNISPIWSAYHSDFTGATNASASRVPSTYVVAFYDGSKLDDLGRGKLIYKNLVTNASTVKPAMSQLGIDLVTGSAPHAAAQPASGFPAWYIGDKSGKEATDQQGIIKSKVMSHPVMLAAETDFLLAEAALNSHVLDGDATTNFDKGIGDSFTYLLKFGSTNAVPSGTDVPALVATYKADNAGDYLVDYSFADTPAKKLEAIITQKYLALNFIHGHESWSEFRRTSYPKSDASGNPKTDLSSTASVSPRADKLPVRSLYPQTELNANPNAPRGLSPFTSLLFWDAN
jgi:hypothetical protein